MGEYGVHKTIYVGNLPFTSSEDDVRALFQPHGEVRSVKLITDRGSGRPRGFGFVEMEAAAAEAAIAALNGHELAGRALRINVARQRTGHRIRRPF